MTLILVPEKIADNVYMIDTKALGWPRTVAAYLILGAEVALIDMGYRSSFEAIMHSLRELGIDRLDYLLPTHVHLDHCGSCGTLASEFHDARVMAHPIAMEHLIDPARLIAGTRELFGQELIRKYGLPDPVSSDRVAQMPNGHTIDLGKNLLLRSIWTPGHAPHQVSYELEGTGMVFTGDAVGVFFPALPVLVPTTPPPSFDLDQAVHSLRLLGRSNPDQLCTPHFGVLKQAKDRIQRNIDKLIEWKEKIDGLKSAGVSIDSLITSLTDEVGRQAGVDRSGIPDYLQVLLKVSILGFVRYLERRT